MIHFDPRSRALVALVVSLSLLTALGAEADHDGSNFAASIEAAHGGEAWNAKQAITADIVVNFGGNRMLAGSMTTDTPVARTRFELEDGTRLVFDGEMAWTSPADSTFQGTRFHVLTWPYFLAAPMKLDDPGAHLESLGKKPWRDGQQLEAARLTFGEGVGDSPDDWYIVYRDAENRLAGMAYIVTFGKSKDEAEKEPHAITYHDFQEIDGVAVATTWKFWNWSEAKGIEGDSIGDVSLSNIRFTKAKRRTFKQPKDARPEPAPGG